MSKVKMFKTKNAHRKISKTEKLNDRNIIGEHPVTR